MKKKSDNIYFKEEDKPEFNMMAYYMRRMDKRSEERDSALNEGDIKTFYRCTMSLLMNSIPRFRQKKMADEEIAALKTELLKIGSKLKNLGLQAETIRDKNTLVYEEELFEYNIRLNTQMFRYGLIYPINERKEIQNIIEDDF